MIARPTTDQILADCCAVLTNDVLPAVGDETTQIRIVMLEKVLRNMAVRAAHEIAWMSEEVAAIEAYARSVDAALESDGLRDALAGLGGADRDSLHLADVAQVYGRAGGVLSTCLEAALAASAEDLVRQGESLLDARLRRESEIVGGWDSAGR